MERTTTNSIGVGLVDPERTILREIADPRMKRDDIAATYAFLLRAEGVDIEKVNRAILDRWSMNALHYIKDRARKLYLGKRVR